VWLVFAIAWFAPSLHLPLREITALGLTAAICRTLVVVDWQRRGVASTDLVGLALAADTALVAGLLDLTGGPYNPFIVMYVVYVWAAAVLASRRWGLLTATIALLGFAWLVFDHLQAEKVEHHRVNDLPTHLFTTWLAATTVAELVASYVSAAEAALALRQRELEQARERAARGESLASLATMAAGAAHELSTPLGTIALVARELQRNIEQSSVDVDALREDARLMRAEVERCRVILDGMSGRARGDIALSADPLPPATLAQMAEDGLTDAQRRRLRVEISPGTGLPSGSGSEVAQALTLLLRNAFDASTGDTPVELRFRPQQHMVRMEIRDQGRGMSEETLRRAGEPFYTTKEPGSGLGLGLFLVRTFAERTGGNLRFEVGGGTTAILEVPSAQTPAGQA
jgi:two-component system sensor histidine kinase RegB